MKWRSLKLRLYCNVLLCVWMYSLFPPHPFFILFISILSKTFASFHRSACFHPRTLCYRVVPSKSPLYCSKASEHTVDRPWRTRPKPKAKPPILISDLGLAFSFQKRRQVRRGQTKAKRLTDWLLAVIWPILFLLALVVVVINHHFIELFFVIPGQINRGGLLRAKTASRWLLMFLREIRDYERNTIKEPVSLFFHSFTNLFFEPFLTHNSSFTNFDWIN